MDPKEELWVQGLREWGAMRFRPLGGSMIPFLRAGDIVTIVPGKPCRVGDIALWRQNGNLMLHRVVGKKCGSVFTKGDATDRLDSPVSSQDILGRAVSLERRGVTRPLDSLGSRLLGLAFCLTVSWVPKLVALLAAAKSLGREKLGLTGSLNPR
jgi:hypothetical protein